MSTHHADLFTALARLEAQRRGIQSAREAIRKHSAARVDDVNRTIAAVERVRGDDEDDGGILVHRAHRKLLNERSRLENLARGWQE